MQNAPLNHASAANFAPRKAPKHATNLALALSLAGDGFPIYPCAPNKRPLTAGAQPQQTATG